jgi:hypothetical protein
MRRIALVVTPLIVLASARLAVPAPAQTCAADDCPYDTGSVGGHIIAY